MISKRIEQYFNETKQLILNYIYGKERETPMKETGNDNTEPQKNTSAVSLKDVTDKLEQGIQDLFNSDRYKEYLSVMAKFYNYSINNTILIAMQKPDATLVAGFSAWQKNFERTVKKGEKGIKIIAPCPRKIIKEVTKIDPVTKAPMRDESGKVITRQEEVTIPAFKVVTVFDVSQTDGKELPRLAVDSLSGQVEQYEDFFKALSATSPVPVSFEKLHPEIHGYYSSMTQNIVIAEGMSELQTLKTFIHEISHSMLHGKEGEEHRVDRNTKEVQAESIAYTVCQHYGLDTSDYSFGYVAGWSHTKGLDELKNSLSIIHSTAQKIIENVDKSIMEIQKAREEQIAPTIHAVVPKSFYNSFGIHADKPSVRNQLKSESKSELPAKEQKQKNMELEV